MFFLLFNRNISSNKENTGFSSKSVIFSKLYLIKTTKYFKQRLPINYQLTACGTPVWLWKRMITALCVGESVLCGKNVSSLVLSTASLSLNAGITPRNLQHTSNSLYCFTLHWFYKKSPSHWCYSTSIHIKKKEHKHRASVSYHLHVSLINKKCTICNAWYKINKTTIKLQVFYCTLSMWKNTNLYRQASLKYQTFTDEMHLLTLKRKRKKHWKLLKNKVSIIFTGIPAIIEVWTLSSLCENYDLPFLKIKLVEYFFNSLFSNDLTPLVLLQFSNITKNQQTYTPPHTSIHTRREHHFSQIKYH